MPWPRRGVHPMCVSTRNVLYKNRIYKARHYMIEGSLEVKLPTTWADNKYSQEGAEINSDVEKVRERR